MKYLVSPKNMKIFASGPDKCCPKFCWGKLCSGAKMEPC